MSNTLHRDSMNSPAPENPLDSHDALAVGPSCRFCGAGLTHTLVDLGMSPLCESYVSREQLNHMEPFYPLHAYVCGECFLVQLEAYVSAEQIFSEYAYFSSFSDSWVEHARQYTNDMVRRFGIDNHNHVVEIASNDGYLLQHFVRRGIPSLGIEPAANIAEVAVANGVPTLVAFFGEQTAIELTNQGKTADLLIGNNVLAQVPDVNDFVRGMKLLLNPNGVITLEFPHLLRTLEGNQFDQIYHEHFSYFSFLVVEQIFEYHGITLFDVETLPTHGGSLRIFGRHQEENGRPVEDSVRNLRDQELAAGLSNLETYDRFSEQVKTTKRSILEFLISAKREGQSVVGYGAPGKGNTLLNYCGIRTDFLDYTVDRNPYKQGKFLPGTHVPIYDPSRIRQTRPDYLLILPWNFKDEIMSQCSYLRDWGGQFVIPIPSLTIT